MYKKILAIGMVGLLVMSSGIFIRAQEDQKVLLRYKFNIGDIWKYECITESEKESKIPGEKHLRNIKEVFRYEVTEITPEIKVNLTTTPTESKGVSIIADEKRESHNFGAGYNYEETVLDSKGKMITLTMEAWCITDTLLLIDSPGMIRYLRPVMPETEVGINDTWSYTLALMPQRAFRGDILAHKSPTTITYKVIAFEKKDGFDCVKIEYTYEQVGTDAMLKDFLRQEGVPEERFIHITAEDKYRGKGTIYFAYNEGFLVSRKENYFYTSRLHDSRTEQTSEHIERIGFTMNYIKP